MLVIITPNKFIHHEFTLHVWRMYNWAEQSVTDKKVVALETFSLYKFRLTKAPPSRLQLLLLAPNDKLLLN